MKLGITSLRSDRDLARLVDDRLPLASVESLSQHGMSDEEIYSFIVPRRPMVHRKTRRESLTHYESDRAVRIARITSLAEEVFGDNAKAYRWLRKVKSRFEGRSTMKFKSKNTQPRRQCQGHTGRRMFGRGELSVLPALLSTTSTHAGSLDPRSTTRAKRSGHLH